MNIPYAKLHPSKMRAYGAGGFELTPGMEEPGCPRLYRLRYEESEKSVEMGANLQYGGVIHRAIDQADSVGVLPTEILEEIWPTYLGPERYEEALRDLATFERRHDPYVTLAREVELTAPLLDAGDDHPAIQLAGILDRVAIHPRDPHILIVEDYKTNRFPPSRTDLDQWVQGKTYGAVARHHAAKWGIEEPVRIIGRYHALKWQPLEVDLTDDDLDVFVAWARSVAMAILNDDEGAPRLNPGCGWCPVKSTCPAFRNLPGRGSETLLDRIDRAPLDERARLLPHIKDAIRALEAGKESTEEAIKEKVRHSGPFDPGDGFEFTLQSATRRVVTDPELLHGIMGDDYYVAKPRLGDLDEWKKKHPDQAAAIDFLIEAEPAGTRLKRTVKKSVNPLDGEA